jgi:hypothetical protein
MSRKGRGVTRREFLQRTALVSGTLGLAGLAPTAALSAQAGEQKIGAQLIGKLEGPSLILMGDVALSVMSLPETTPPGGGGGTRKAHGAEPSGPCVPPQTPRPLPLALTPRARHTAPLARDAGDYTDNATSRIPKCRVRLNAHPIRHTVVEN